jgi:hypothetical protein
MAKSQLEHALRIESATSLPIAGNGVPVRRGARTQLAQRHAGTRLPAWHSVKRQPVGEFTLPAVPEMGPVVKPTTYDAQGQLGVPPLCCVLWPKPCS